VPFKVLPAELLELGLGAAHASSVRPHDAARTVRRDLKPSNVMLTTGSAGRSGVTSAKCRPALLVARGDFVGFFYEGALRKSPRPPGGIDTICVTDDVRA